MKIFFICIFAIILFCSQDPVQIKINQEKILLAIKSCDLAKVKQYLAQGISPDFQDSLGHTPLEYAIIACSSSTILKLILDKKVNIDKVILKTQMTALRQAIFEGKNDVVGILLKYGANPNLILSDGISPLRIAVGNDNIEAVKLLLLKGSEVNYWHPKYGSAFIEAVHIGDSAMIDLLIVKGIRFNEYDSIGYTPLIIASNNSDKRTVKLLLQKGVDINEKDTSGNTALIYAVIAGNNEMVDFLLNNGANPLIANLKTVKLNATMYAIETGNENCLKILLKYDRSFDDESLAKRAWIKIAEKHAYHKIVEILRNANNYKAK